MRIFMLYQRNRILISTAVLGQIIFVSIGYAVSADEITVRATNATRSLARGDVNRAANQVIGGYRIPVSPSETMIYASPSRVGVQQGIKPLSVRYPNLNLGTTYQAAANPLQPKTISQNVRVNTGTPYFSNTTSVPVPPVFRQKKE